MITFGTDILIIMAACLGFLGAVFYRMRGMDENSVPSILRSRLLRRALSVLVLIPGAYLAGAGVWALLAAPIAFYGIIVGHGSYMDLGTVDRPDNEVFAPLLDKIFGPEYVGHPNFWRDFTGLALTGLLVTVPVSLLPGIGWEYALIGFMKPIAYFLTKDTERGEMGWGASYASSLVFA